MRLRDRFAPLATLAAVAIGASACTVEATGELDAGAGTGGPDADLGGGGGGGPDADLGGGGGPDAGLGMTPDGGGGGGGDECQASGANLLANPNFDDGASVAPWERAGQTQIFSDGSALGEPESSPNALAILGATSGDATATVSQSVAIPQGITSLELSFFECFVNQGLTGGPDEMSIEVRDPASGDVLDTLDTFDSESDGTSGCSFELLRTSSSDPSGYAGRTVELTFFAETIGGNDTATFSIDTISLTASCP